MTTPYAVNNDGISGWKVALIAVICLVVGFYCGARVDGSRDTREFEEAFVSQMSALVADERRLAAASEVCTIRECTDVEWADLMAQYNAYEKKRLDLLEDLLEELD